MGEKFTNQKETEVKSESSAPGSQTDQHVAGIVVDAVKRKASKEAPGTNKGSNSERKAARRKKLASAFLGLKSEKLIRILKVLDLSRLILKKDPSLHLEEDLITAKEVKKAKAKSEQLQKQLNLMKKKAQRKAKIQDNPYLKGREAWNDLYGTQSVKLENAYRIMAILALGLVVAMIGFVVIAGQSKVEPYIVRMQNNQILGVAPAEQHMPLSKQVVAYTLDQFVRDSRSVIADNSVQKKYTSTAYSLVQGQAANIFKQYIQGNNPFELNKKITRAVKINYTLHLQGSSYQVGWTETTRDMNGNLLTQQKYVAVLTYKFGPVTSGLIQYNPFGIYITNITWNQTA